jgi:hypothetical protein
MGLPRTNADHGAHLSERHVDRCERCLVLQQAELALDLLDPELHLLQLVLDSKRGLDRRRPSHQPQEHRLLSLPGPKSCVEIDEL